MIIQVAPNSEQGWPVSTKIRHDYVNYVNKSKSILAKKNVAVAVPQMSSYLREEKSKLPQNII